MAQPPLFPTPSVYLVRNSVSKGLLGDNRFWKLVAFFIIGRRMLRRIMGSEPRTVAVERIRAGETIILRGVTTRRR
jgi:hypothetical protein